MDFSLTAPIDGAEMTRVTVQPLLAEETNDYHIRPLLRDLVRAEHDQGDTVLVEEFALYGGSIRADLVARNGSLPGLPAICRPRRCLSLSGKHSALGQRGLLVHDESQMVRGADCAPVRRIPNAFPFGAFCNEAVAPAKILAAPRRMLHEFLSQG